MNSERGLDEFFSETLTMSDVVSYEGSSGSGDNPTVTVKTIADPLTGYTLLAIGECLWLHNPDHHKQGDVCSTRFKKVVPYKCSIALSFGPFFVGWADNGKAKTESCCMGTKYLPHKYLIHNFAAK